MLSGTLFSFFPFFVNLGTCKNCNASGEGDGGKAGVVPSFSANSSGM